MKTNQTSVSSNQECVSQHPSQLPLDVVSVLESLLIKLAPFHPNDEQRVKIDPHTKESMLLKQMCRSGDCLKMLEDSLNFQIALDRYRIWLANDKGERRREQLESQDFQESQPKSGSPSAPALLLADNLV